MNNNNLHIILINLIELISKLKSELEYDNYQNKQIEFQKKQYESVIDELIQNYKKQQYESVIDELIQNYKKQQSEAILNDESKITISKLSEYINKHIMNKIISIKKNESSNNINLNIKLNKSRFIFALLLFISFCSICKKIRFSVKTHDNLYVKF